MTNLEKYEVVLAYFVKWRDAGFFTPIGEDVCLNHLDELWLELSEEEREESRRKERK